MMSFSFRIAAMDAPMLTGLKDLTAAKTAPGRGDLGLRIPEIWIGAKADGSAFVIFAVDHQGQHKILLCNKYLNMYI